MIPDIAVFDSLLPAAEAARIRADVIKTGFKTEIGPDNMEYPNTNLNWYSELKSAMEVCFGRKINVKLSAFRIAYEDTGHDFLVHCDLLCANWAAVWYLPPDGAPQSGTAFYKHKGLNTENMPSRESVAKLGIDPDWFAGMMQREWNIGANWEQSGYVAQAFNRLLVYPAMKHHGRFPLHGYGDKPENGRLIWACFFDFEGETPNSYQVAK